MGFRDKLQKYYADNYMKKYGDRITQAYGSVLSVKVEEKKYLFIFNTLQATIILKPEGTKTVVKKEKKIVRFWRSRTSEMSLLEKISLKLMLLCLKGKLSLNGSS